MRVQPGVWGVGDVTGKGAFTYVATYQARICVADILGHPMAEADYRALPRVTFTDPEIGSVGMTEASARMQSGGEVQRDVRADRRNPPAAGSTGAKGFVKLVEKDGVLVGATSMGPSVGERVLGLLTLAVHARVPVRTLKEMIYRLPDVSTGPIDFGPWRRPSRSRESSDTRPIWRGPGAAAARGDPRRGRWRVGPRGDGGAGSSRYSGGPGVVLGSLPDVDRCGDVAELESPGIAEDPVVLDAPAPCPGASTP